MAGTQHTGHRLGNVGSGPEDADEPPAGAAVADCRGFPGLHLGPAPPPAPRLPAGMCMGPQWGLSGSSQSRPSGEPLPRPTGPHFPEKGRPPVSEGSCGPAAALG